MSSDDRPRQLVAAPPAEPPLERAEREGHGHERRGGGAERRQRSPIEPQRIGAAPVDRLCERCARGPYACARGMVRRAWPRARRIPEATVARLPVYLRSLLELAATDRRRSRRSGSPSWPA